MSLLSKIADLFCILLCVKTPKSPEPVPAPLDPAKPEEVVEEPVVAPVVDPVTEPTPEIVTPAPVIKDDKPEEQAPWMKYAASLIGIKEIAGAKHNSTILSWAKNLGKFVGILYDADEIAWCGLYAGEVMLKAGFTPPKICVRASEWSKFGEGINEPSYGAIMVFTRNGGGHVGFYVSEDETTYHILGGNQSNSVNITRIEKSRLNDIRWPTGVDLPFEGRKYRKFSGTISKNEA